MLTRRKAQKSKKVGIPSSKQFYYLGPPSKGQLKKGIEEVRTTGPLINLQCSNIDPKSKQQCKRRTVIGCGICWQHLRKNNKLRIKKSTLLVDGVSVGLGLFALDVGDKDEVVFPKRTPIIKYSGDINREYREKRGMGMGLVLLP